MKDFRQQFADLYPNQVMGRLEIFRGDGWQVVLPSPSLALDAAVFLRAVCKACPLSQPADSKLGIGIGSVDAIHPENRGESQGKAFEASGDALSRIRWEKG